ncbi:hypothetical protein [uncultured Mucilaginibacter sp.]|uniref:hypothetical protein n=1 Tax=uncultured Mucilaginibacter sp. TaxID=797541 RepID=UPI0025DF189F|nr:hypothetical protein [uncultured Mucilaginibacter sp.]
MKTFHTSLIEKIGRINRLIFFAIIGIFTLCFSNKAMAQQKKSNGEAGKNQGGPGSIAPI